MPGYSLRDQVSVLDCTIRDGGYITEWQFDTSMVRECYRALSKAGVDYVELGYRDSASASGSNPSGMWRRVDETLLAEVTDGIDGAAIAVMVDYGKTRVDDFPTQSKSRVHLVRMAVHKTQVHEALRWLEALQAKGYRVALNVMGYPNYTPQEQHDLAAALRQSSIDMVYVVDSYGSLFPHQVRALVEPLTELGHITVGFHPHNNLQMAVANTLEALHAGARIVDGSLYGLGRGAGNLPTEILIMALERFGGHKYNAVPLFNCIDAHLLPLRSSYSWGYQLPYLLSGMSQVHPSYAKTLVDMHEFTIEDIYKAMEVVKHHAPVGFNPEVLQQVVEGGLIGRRRIDQRVEGAHPPPPPTDRPVPYAERHVGRDILVLANGPSLKLSRERIDAFIKKLDPIVLGANFLDGMFTPHYHAFTNKKRFMKYHHMVADRSTLLLSEHFEEDWIREYTARPYLPLRYVDVLSREFAIDRGILQSNCRTISVLLIGVAIVMGARRIFVAGMDCYLGCDQRHPLYYEEPDEHASSQSVIERHQWCQRYLELIDQYLRDRGQEGIHILTPTSYRAFYKGIANYIGPMAKLAHA